MLGDLSLHDDRKVGSSNGCNKCSSKETDLRETRGLFSLKKKRMMIIRNLTIVQDNNKKEKLLRRIRIGVVRLIQQTRTWPKTTVLSAVH